ncbi:ABC transporter substrate-binding protein [Albidovulum sp.]|uniref:ABC transporter substrate-binding protein n=1 Tax=Albidovulum sp. TaxID=1872424 RepID=UPI001D542E71|nr:sugar ABC transporter substrate-binding protein [Paracoccaceae bacterium]HPE24119.1 sugar ABC transporter substrate-binding protein [Albidovulum sp.]MCB2132339.1 sugar ABC transporter substrate-binding protein [Paracoccaceae bacterium]MCB2141723.1 sugar ABC transporter substrate-binding protein [Paracoccaceae bacterium]MCB2149849.1 sugar ABC transporter substrate-binding protein [Paracoccaceae bacterium]
MKLKKLLLSAGTMAMMAVSGSAWAEEITIATVNNNDMIVMQELAPKWEEATGNKINWVVLEENVLRQRTTQDISTNGGSFDIMFIGAYETPIWGKNGWLASLDDFADDAAYDLNDIFQLVRNGLSAEGHLYAVPLYSETSFTYYRSDLFEKAGIAKPTEQITYDQFAEMVSKVHDPENGVYGTCQRGKAGWGENMAFVGTLANAFGARWFDEQWQPQLDSPEWNAAIHYYVDLMTKYGPPGATANGHNENRALFKDGKCATWVDATSAANDVKNPANSKVADVTDFFQAPKQATDKGTGWFWSWALAIPASSQKVDTAKDFLKWATSKEYFQMVGETKGWVAVPSGTRASIHEDPRLLEAAPFAETIKNAIFSVDPADPTRDPVPYTGVQFVAIPEFQGIGNFVGQQVAAALAGQMSVEDALSASQDFAVREMTKAGYIK